MAHRDEARADYLGGAHGHAAHPDSGRLSVAGGGVTFWPAGDPEGSPLVVIEPQVLVSVGPGPGSEDAHSPVNDSLSPVNRSETHVLLFEGERNGDPVDYAFRLDVVAAWDLVMAVVAARRAAHLPEIPAEDVGGFRI